MSFSLLSSIQAGEKCVFHHTRLDGATERRLEDMGLLPDTEMHCACKAPSGTPIAFWVKGSLIAIRRSDCERIMVTRCE